MTKMDGCDQQPNTSLRALEERTKSAARRRRSTSPVPRRSSPPHMLNSHNNANRACFWDVWFLQQELIADVLLDWLLRGYGLPPKQPSGSDEIIR